MRQASERGGRPASERGIRLALRAPACFTRRMQLRASCLCGDRPEECLVCFHPRLHIHGTYERHDTLNAKSDEMEDIPRFICARCRTTYSILPDKFLPYRSLSVDTLEACFDAALKGARGPPITEIERGCVHRALRRLNERVAPLQAILGQMLKAIRPTAQQLWKGLREWGNLKEILYRLARDFKTSLLGCYRCVRLPQPAVPFLVRSG